MGRESSSADWKPAQLSKDLLLKLSSEKEILSMEAGTGDLERRQEYSLDV